MFGGGTWQGETYSVDGGREEGDQVIHVDAPWRSWARPRRRGSKQWSTRCNDIIPHTEWQWMRRFSNLSQLTLEMLIYCGGIIWIPSGTCWSSYVSHNVEIPTFTHKFSPRAWHHLLRLCGWVLTTMTRVQGPNWRRWFLTCCCYRWGLPCRLPCLLLMSKIRTPDCHILSSTIRRNMPICLDIDASCWHACHPVAWYPRRTYHINSGPKHVGFSMWCQRPRGVNPTGNDRPEGQDCSIRTLGNFISFYPLSSNGANQFVITPAEQRSFSLVPFSVKRGNTFPLFPINFSNFKKLL